MEEWIAQVLNASEFGILVLPAGFLLGLITSVGAGGCCLPVLAAVAGYAGTRQDINRRDVLLTGACFTLASVLSLAAAGALVGYFGQVVGASLGIYGKMLIGFMAIVFGFLALDLFPFRLPTFAPAPGKLPRGVLGASVLGLAAGGANTTCAMTCCGPVLLPIVLGLAALRGEGAWGALILATFAVGYSLPMVAVMLGVGLGKLSGIATKIAGPIRMVSGVVMIGVGFWLLLPI